MTTVALIPAAGMGTRLGENRPKAFVDLCGATILERSVDSARRSGVVDHVVIAVPAELAADAAAMVPDAEIVVGGQQRSDSVRAGLAASSGAARIVVHDAARALTPPDVFIRVTDALSAGAVAVTPVLAVADTLKRVNPATGVVRETLDRASLRAVQTPQGFIRQILARAHADARDATDDAGLVEHVGGQVHIVPGDPMAFKITTAFDLRMARLLIGESS